MSFSELEQKVIKAIDDNKEKIIEVAQKILENPELGYKEFETSKLIKEEFEKLSLRITENIAYTGVKGVIGNEKDFNVCIMGELDSVVCTEHKYAGKDGAAHACGHNGQLASMLGAAIGITSSGVMNELKGGVTFMAVPAE
ncbi:MAG: amidohydrolase, partial [Clostridia bacterium]|nr:amidohydrolase [Clostridia bacterium]